MDKISKKDTKCVKLSLSSGVTIISLVITIIVLMILAGVSIKIIQDKGIIGSAQNAKEIHEEAIQQEENFESELKNLKHGKYATSIDGTLKIEDNDSLLLKNYRIYGNSVQEGTPTPEAPVEVQSVGELVTEGEHEGEYKIPITVTGKNLFEYKKGNMVNGVIVEETEAGSIVKGNQSTAGDYLYARGWYRPGETTASGNGVVLNSGDIVTISADITLMEIGMQEADTSILIHLYERSLKGGITSGAQHAIPVTLNEVVRVSKSFTITDKYSGGTFYPVFCVNSHKVKIENIQIEKGNNSTEYEPYKGITTNIYLKEPLRGITTYAYYTDTKTNRYQYDLDYIDLENRKIVRKIKEYIVSDISKFNKQADIAYNNINKDIYVRTVSQIKDMTSLHPGGGICQGDILSNYIGRYQRNDKILNESHHLYTANTYKYMYFYWDLQKLGFTVEESTVDDYLLRTSASNIQYYNVYDGETKLTDFAQIKEKIGKIFAEPVKIYYPLATPIEEDIDLPDIPLLEGGSNITVNTTIAPSRIEVNY